MRQWKPKKLLPEEHELPPPGDEYFEIETLKACGYTLSEWRRESLVDRAKLMAHELHKNMRESYYAEKMSGKGEEKGKGKAPAPWDMEAMRKQMFTK